MAVTVIDKSQTYLTMRDGKWARMLFTQFGEKRACRFRRGSLKGEGFG
jgi:hypothetical protein